MGYIACIFLMASSSGAEYASTEILVIPWGDSPNQLKIDLPFYEDVNFTPEDSSDDWIETAGPNQGFVDDDENVFINSYALCYLKGFESNGDLILNHSFMETPVDTNFHGSQIGQFYLDTVGHLFILSSPPISFVSLTDMNMNLLGRLSPHEIPSTVSIHAIFRNSDDVLTFSADSGYWTYRNGRFDEGGSSYWLAKDGYYYGIYSGYYIDYSLPYSNGKDSLVFVKSIDPDINGNAAWESRYYIFSADSINSAELIGVSDDMNIYVGIYLRGQGSFVQVYDTTYSQIAQFPSPAKLKDFNFPISPFMRHDGTVYIFQALDDGLHVIRWSRQ